MASTALSDDTFETTLSVGKTVAVCLRTAEQTCPGSGNGGMDEENVAPEFASATLDRSMNETVGDATVSTPANIGDAITATDGNSDTLTYTLEGTDKDKFTIVSSTGQIRTKAGESYSHEADDSYSVTVKADDSNGGTDTVDVTIAINDVNEPPQAPAAPTVTATAGSTTSLDVQWSAPANGGRPDIVHYDLQYRQGTGGNWTDGPQGVAGTSTAIPNLTAGESYQVQVRASNDEGDGAWSASGSGATQTTIPSVTIADASATEGQAVRFTVTLSSTTSADVTVDWSAAVGAGDTATLVSSAPGGADFTASSGTLTIKANQSTATIDVPTTADNVDEPDETFTVTLTNPGNATLGTASSATGTITDNDATPQVTLALTPDSISEKDGTSTVTATLDRASSEATTVTVSAAAVSPAVSADFTQSGTTLTIAAGQTSSTGEVTIAANDNAAAEGSKSVTVSGTVTNTQGATAPSDKTLTITDDESVSTALTLTVSPSTVSEGATGSARTVTVTATLNGAARGSDTEVAVSVYGATATGGGGLVPGGDFEEVDDFTLTIAQGSTEGTATFRLKPIDDNVDEPDETVVVQGTATGLTVNPLDGVEVTIEDNDDTPTVTLALSQASISEDGGSSTVTASLDHPSSEATTVTVSATAGTGADAADFTLSANKKLTIAAGQTTSTGTVTIAANDNDIYTGDKSVTVSGTAANDLAIVQPTAKTLTIEEDDTASTTVTLSLSKTSVAEGATGDARKVTVTATLNGAARPEDTAVAVTVAAGTAVEAEDFVAVSGFTVTIPKGSTEGSADFGLAPVDDKIDEPDETVTVSGTTAVSGLTVLPSAGLTVTITDNDAAPTVTLELDPASISENGGSSTVTATLDHPSSEATTVTVSTAPGTGADAADFTQTGTALTIAAGQTTSTGTVTIAANDNSVGDGDRSVTVSATVANTQGATAPTAKTLTITDDETASTGLTLTVSPASVSEDAGATQVTVTATLNGAARESDTSVAVSVAGNTAVAGTDFGAVSDFTVTILKGSTEGSAAFALTPIDDETDEPDETVTVSGTATGLTVGPAGGVAVTIQDDDAAPTVTLALTPASISENGGSSTVTATLDHPSSEATTVTVSATAVHPAQAGDFTLSVNKTLTIAAGDTDSSGTVTIAANNNDIDHPDREVNVSGAASNSQGITQPTAKTLTITDEEATSTTVTLSVSPSAVSEGATGAAQTVTVTGRLDAAARETDAVVTVSVAGDTAVAGTDFGAVTDFTLTIPKGSTSGTATFTLAPIDDDIDEPRETVTVSGTTTVSGLTVGPSAGVKVTIEDNDAAPTVTLALTPASIPENGGSSTVTATLDHPSSEATTVTVSATAVHPAVAGDFTLSGNKTLTIAAGDTDSSGTVTISANDNDIDHPDREVTVSGSVSNSQGFTAPTEKTLTITDNEATSSTVTLTVSPATVSEGATGGATVTVTGRLDAAARETDAAVTVSVAGDTAVAGTDFGAVSDITLTIPKGSTEGTAEFTLAPIDDNIDEPDETVTVSGATTVSGLTVGPSAGVKVTISDNDAAPTVILTLTPDSISENGGSSTVTASFDNQRSSEATTITVSAAPAGDAVAGDFSLSVNKTLTIAAGAMTSSGAVTVTGVDNAFDDTGTRTVTVSGSASNSQGIVNPSSKTLTINDDEASSTSVQLSVSPTAVSEGATGAARTVTVTAMLNGSARATAVPVTVSVAGDTAVAGTDFTAVSDFTVTIDAGQTSGNADFTLAPVNDTVDERDETLSISGTTTATGLTVGTASVTLEDDDPAPVVTLTLTPDAISEDGGSTAVTASLDRPSVEDTTITVSAAAGTGAAAADFDLSVNTELTIAAGDTASSGTVTVTANDNGIYTGDKSVTVSATAANDLGIGQPGAKTLAIEEDDTESTMVTLSVSPNRVAEDATGNAQVITVTAALDEAARPAATDVAVTVDGVSAVEGTDFTAVPDFTVTIAAGSTSGSGTFTLAPVDDNIDEPDETVRVSGTTAVTGLTMTQVNLIVTIGDNDATPQVTLALAPASISENGGSTQVTASLDHPSSQATTITVTATAVHPAVAADFTQTGTTITIAAGETTSTDTVTVAGVDNVIDHPDREVEITGVAVNALAIDQPGPETLTITDNEETSTTVTLEVNDLIGPNAVEEGDSATVTVTATLDKAAREQDAAVEIEVSGGTSVRYAKVGEDFSAVSAFVVTIPAGMTSGSQSFTLTTLDDEIAEGTDSTPVELVAITGEITASTLGPPLTVEPEDPLEVQIADDDPAARVTLELTPDTVSENGGVSTVTATLDRLSGSAVLISLALTPEAPATADDYSLSSTTLLIPAGQTSSIGDVGANPVTITGVDDTTVGNRKGVKVAGTASGGRVVQPEETVLTITDDDTPSTQVILTVSPASVPEDGGATPVTVTATFDGASRSTPTEVEISVAGGTAVAGTDYTAVSDFKITIPANMVSGKADFTLEPKDDETDAPDRTVQVDGSTTASGLTVGPAGGLTVTIADDDPSPEVTLVLAPASISENGGSSTVTATLDRPSSGQTVIEVTAAPVNPAVAEDFRLNGTRLTIAAGQTTSSGTVTVTAVDNDVAAADKEVVVSGTATTAGPGIVQPEAQTLAIEDNDQPSTTVTLSLAPDEVSEGATGAARTVRVTAELDGAARSADTGVEISVNEMTALEGEDFAAVSNFTVTIPAGQRSGSTEFTLPVLEDTIDEPDETVLVEGVLLQPGLGLEPPGGLILTIADNEPEPVVSLVLTPDSIREDGGVSTVTAVLDSPSLEETTITVTATPVAPAVDGDFVLTGTTLTIPAGDTESTGTVTIEAVDNETEAPNKQVTVSAATENALGVGGPEDETLTITDNEFPSTTATLSVSPAQVTEGDTTTITVTATLDGAARPADTVITVSVGAGTASADDFQPVNDITLTILADEKSGTATFDLVTVQDETDEPDETVKVTGRTSGLTIAPPGGVTVTIANDDPDPRVTLVLTPDSISENGGSSKVTAELDRPSSRNTVVTVSATAQPPAVAGDFRLIGTGLTIPAGAVESTGSATISGVDNQLTGPNKQVEVSGAAENGEGVTQPLPETLTITDDDQPSTMVTLTISPDELAEDGGTKRLTVTGMLDGAPEAADTVVTLTVNAGAVEAAEAVLTIPIGQRRATAALSLTPVDNDIDAADAVVTVNATTTSPLALAPSSLDVTVTDDDERGVVVSPVSVTVREGMADDLGDLAATYTVVLGTEPTATVTVTPSPQSPPAGSELTLQPSSLTFTSANWDEPQTVTVTTPDDTDVEEDAEVEIAHTVSGGDYGANNVTASVTATVLGFEETTDGAVSLKAPSSGEPTVTVPEGTSAPAGMQVTIPPAQGGEILTIEVADAPEETPQGFRSGDTVVSIEFADGATLDGEATVCLPSTGGGQRVYHYDGSLDPPEWVELDPPAGGSPPGLACGVTDSFSLFALGTAPGGMAVSSWLSRFGRTVAQQVVEWVEDRLSAPREPGLRGKVAGRSLGGPVAHADPDSGHAGGVDAPDGARKGRSRGVSGRELLTGTSFTLTGEETGSGSLAVWGRAAHTRFDGRESGASVDGEVTTIGFGIDRAAGPWIWGVSLAHSEGRGAHRLDDRSNRLSSSLTGLYPFAGYKASNGVMLWGVAGYGEGDLELTLEGEDPQETRLTLAMAATGARGELLSGGDGFSLSVETDALFVRTSSGEAENLEATDADASRLRLGLEGSWSLETEEGAQLRPSLKAALRHDGGDAETGLGVEVGGGLSWSEPALGFATDLKAHGLLMHEAGGFAEHGVSGSLTWDRDRSSDRGLALTVKQSLGGGASGGASRLMESETPPGFGREDGSGSGGRFDAELGYGVAVLGNRFTGTPWVGFGLSGGRRDYTLGWRFRPLGPAALDLGLEATRMERANDNQPEHAATLKLRARW